MRRQISSFEPHIYQQRNKAAMVSHVYKHEKKLCTIFSKVLYYEILPPSELKLHFFCILYLESNPCI